MEIKAKLKDAAAGVVVTYDLPTDLKSLVAKFGEAVVAGKAVDSLVIDIQAFVRRHLKGSEKVAPKTQEEIQALVAAYTPGAAAVRKTPVEKVGSLIASMTPEEKAALLKQLRAQS